MYIVFTGTYFCSRSCILLQSFMKSSCLVLHLFLFRSLVNLVLPRACLYSTWNLAWVLAYLFRKNTINEKALRTLPLMQLKGVLVK